MSARIGEAVPRREDLRLLTGRGTYSDDIRAEGQAYAAIVRSPHAHARILTIDTSGAEAVPGVLAVLTGSDFDADGLNPIPHNPTPTHPPDINLENRDGAPKFIAPHMPLPSDRARFAGEQVAVVVAESDAAARDGADKVSVEYEVLPAVTATAEAAADGAPLLRDGRDSNVCIDADVGDPAATAEAFSRADRIVRFETWIRRVTGVPMEPRAALGSWDRQTGRYTVHAGAGGVVRPKNEMAAVLGVEPGNMRMVAKDVGGNFGTRNALFPEFPLMAWASRRVGRPVKWTADRSEAFLSDYQGRDLVVEAELALDKDGNFLALRGSNIGNVGAQTVSFVPLTKGVEIMSSVYNIPAAHFRARAVMSNTPPTNPYRSAGRPEVIFVMERLVDLASRELGIDPVELRRRNMVRPSDMPYPNPLGMTYDSGDYPGAMEMCLKLGDWDGFAARKADTESRGLRRGRGLAAYMETSTGAPRERTEITVRPDGQIDAVIGTLSSGQGHETSFCQLISEWLGVDLHRINLITGDTDIVSVGGGSHSGRSMRLAGIIMGKATDEIIDKGRRIAAHLLEAAEADIEFADGCFTVAGTDRSASIFDIAGAAAELPDLPDELKGKLDAVCDETVRIPAFPYGCHLCEVEVDTETGQVQIVKYSGVDDVGRAINPLILHGQAHGGIVQGLGQALLELCHYDPDTGQNLTGSFMDYAMPRADNMPSFAVEISEVPSPTNKLGVRAGGEGGTTPALAALINAIVDALWDDGVRHVEMPATPQNVWRAIREARKAG